MSRFILGPLKRVNLGISFDAQRIVGSGDPHMIRPSVFFKVHFFDGNDYLPALAIGLRQSGFSIRKAPKNSSIVKRDSTSSEAMKYCSRTWNCTPGSTRMILTITANLRVHGADLQDH